MSGRPRSETEVAPVQLSGVSSSCIHRSKWWSGYSIQRQGQVCLIFWLAIHQEHVEEVVQWINKPLSSLAADRNTLLLPTDVPPAVAYCQVGSSDEEGDDKVFNYIWMTDIAEEKSKGEAQHL